MNRKALAAIKQFQMLEQGDRLAVGVSGGGDSVALLHFLHSIAGEWRLTLMALHLNHQLRGSESDRDEVFVRELCARWGIPLVAESAPVAQLAARQGLSIEECARQVRYDFFRRNAGGEVAGDKIATAHTLSDSAETLLLNLTRGTAVRGLCGIPPVRDNIVRPLIGCTRGEVEAYCAAHGLAYVTDSTNLADAYTRNRLRHAVVPVLLERNPGWLETVSGTMAALREDADYLDAQAAKALAGTRLGGDCFSREGLLALPGPLLMRALLLLLGERGIPVERRRLEQLRAILSRGSGGAQLSGQWLCRCTATRLEFTAANPPSEEPFLPVSLASGLQNSTIPVFSDKKLMVTCVEYEVFTKNMNNQANLLKNALDCDRIEKIAAFRLRLPGDSIRLAGRGCTKSLKKLLSEQAIPDRQRRRIVLLADEDGPLWVEGFGVAERVQVSPDTRRVLIVNVEDRYAE